jgi:hypothetical protein
MPGSKARRRTYPYSDRDDDPFAGDATRVIGRVTDLPKGTRVVLACRVSTPDQERAGNLTEQRDRLAAELTALGYEVVDAFTHAGEGWQPGWLRQAAPLAAVQAGRQAVDEVLSRFPVEVGARLRSHLEAGEIEVDDVLLAAVIQREVDEHGVCFLSEGEIAAAVEAEVDASFGKLKPVLERLDRVLAVEHRNGTRKEARAKKKQQGSGRRGTAEAVPKRLS